MEFLVQYAIEGIKEFTNKIVNSSWIINATNESDINGIVLHVYDITEFGKIKPLQKGIERCSFFMKNNNFTLTYLLIKR